MTTRYITETKWRVQLQTGAPTLQTFEKVLDAPSDQIAIHRAQQMYPNMQFIQVQATQVDGQSGTPVAQQNSSTPNSAGMLPGFHPLQSLRGLTPMWPQGAQQGAQQQPATESVLPFNPHWFSYPYSISLPAQFGCLLKETAPVQVIDHPGQYSVVLETAIEMQRFLSNLTQHHDRQSAAMIIAGIRSSMR